MKDVHSAAVEAGAEDAMRLRAFIVALESIDSLRYQDLAPLAAAYVEVMPKANASAHDEVRREAEYYRREHLAVLEKLERMEKQQAMAMEG